MLPTRGIHFGERLSIGNLVILPEAGALRDIRNGFGIGLWKEIDKEWETLCWKIEIEVELLKFLVTECCCTF